MNVPDYEVGDLIILKPGLWKDDVVRTGVIIELMFHSEKVKERRSFLVMFSNVHRDRKSTRLNSSHIPLSRMPSSA